MKDNLERIRSWAEVWKERETDFASAAPEAKRAPRRSTARRAGRRGALLMLLRTLVSLSGQWRIEMAGDLTVGMADVRPLASYIGSAWRRRRAPAR